ncbi:hypothetical protein MRX96_042114 [Rhipicephalus microplus]
MTPAGRKTQHLPSVNHFKQRNSSSSIRSKKPASTTTFLEAVAFTVRLVFCSELTSSQAGECELSKRSGPTERTTSVETWIWEPWPASFHRRHFDALEEGALLVVDLLPPGGGVRLSDAHDVRALPDKQHHRHLEERHHSSTEDVVQQWVDGIR